MKDYVFVDYATQGYVVLVGLLVVLFHNGTVPHWGWLVAAHVACLVLIHTLIRAQARNRRQPVLDFLRHFYPILLFTGFYRETGLLNRIFVPTYLDAHFIWLEQRLLGFQPSLRFMAALPYLPISELFYAAYFSYYVMIVGVGVALFLRDRRQFFHYVSILSFVFYLCYLCYICLPVMGPRAFFREIGGFQLPAAIQALAGSSDPTYPAAIQHGLFYHIMHWIYHHFEGAGAAFPSSHVAVALVALRFSFLYLRRIRWLHLVVVILLCLSTVYCRYHYAIDVAAGALTAAILIPLGEWLYAWHNHRNAVAVAASTSCSPP